MAVISNNLQLVLPEASDNISVLVFQENFRKIDEKCMTAAGGTMTGEIKMAGYSEKAVSLSGATVNPTDGSVFTKTIASTTTFSFDTSKMSSGYAYSITLVITMSNTAYTVSFPSTVKWSGDEAPAFEANTVTEVVLRTYNGGTTWYGSVGGVF